MGLNQNEKALQLFKEILDINIEKEQNSIIDGKLIEKNIKILNFRI